MREAPAIRELGAGELEFAAALAARGMLENPLNVAAFGIDATRRELRLRRMFRVALSESFKRGVILGAFQGSALVGIAVAIASPRCQLGLLEKAALAPRLIRATGFRPFVRLASWMAVWARSDPREPHWHLGPVVVDANHFGQGVGSALVAEWCGRMDRAQVVGHLETDKAQNLPFYSRFGFRTASETSVLGTRNWFMTRAPVPGER